MMRVIMQNAHVFFTQKIDKLRQKHYHARMHDTRTNERTNDTTRRATRRRDQRVDDLRVTTHAINVLRVMHDENVCIYFDDETCVIMTREQRKISHKCVKSLRAMRFIRIRENDSNEYALTQRAIELLHNDARTRTRVKTSRMCTTREQ